MSSSMYVYLCLLPFYLAFLHKSYTFIETLPTQQKVDCKIQNDPETLFPQMAKIISYVTPRL